MGGISLPPVGGTATDPGGQGTAAGQKNVQATEVEVIQNPDPYADKAQIAALTGLLLNRAKAQSLGESAITQAGTQLSNQLAAQVRRAQKPTVAQLLSDEHFGGRTTWQEARRALTAEEKNILDHAVGQENLADLTREDLANNLLGVGLNREQTKNLLDRAGLAEREVGLELSGGFTGPGGQAELPGRIGLQEASVGDAITYLNQTLTDVDLDEKSFDRQIDTLSDQISMTADQKTEIGLQKTDLNTMDTIAEALRTARETLLGESLEVGKGRIDLVRDKADLDKRATELQADRAERAALRDAYARGASFTTGIREDVADIELGKQLALDEIALQSTGADLSLTELEAGDTFQRAQLTAEKDRAAVDLDANLRALDLEFTDVGYLADRYGRSKADVTDAISRLDTNRLAIQTSIADEARKLSNLGLDRQQVAMRLESIGYDKVDADIALRALDIEESTIDVAGRRVDANEVLSELAVERSLESLMSKRAGAEVAEADENAALAQWQDVHAAMSTEEGQRELLGSIAAQTRANMAINAAMEQYAPMLRGLTKAQYEQMESLLATAGATDYEMDPYKAITEQISTRSGTPAFTAADAQPYLDYQRFVPRPGSNVTFGEGAFQFDPTINVDVPPIGRDEGRGPDGGGFQGPGFSGPEDGDEGGDEGGVWAPPDDWQPPDDFFPEGGPHGPGRGGGPEAPAPEAPAPEAPAPEAPAPEAPAPEAPGWSPPADDPFWDPGFFPGPGGMPRTSPTRRALSHTFGDLGDYKPDPTVADFTVGPSLSDQLTTGDFATDVLTGIGAPVTDNNLATLALWQNMEGQTDQGQGMTGSAAEFNPLATTYGKSLGYDPYNYDETGDPLVWNYPDYQTGVDNTVSTLELGYYDPLVAALQQDIDAATMNYMPEVTNSLGTWSGKGYGGFANAGDPAWMDEIVSQLSGMGGNAVLPVREPQTSFVSATPLVEQYPELAFFY